MQHFMQRLLISTFVVWLVSTHPAYAERAPDVTLRGTIDERAHRTYRLEPFDVPECVQRVDVRFSYTGREARTTIDLGLLGPGQTFAEAFRGWSGGNKSAFQISRSAVTPSYLSGPVTAGRWNLLLGIPNIRAGQTAHFTAEIWFQFAKTATASGGDAAPQAPALRDEPGWYRGDLHLHSGHSDGTCNSRSGDRRVPCPLFLTLEAAAARGLDFIAVTEHNTVSHLPELTALQPYFDRLLLIPGMEVTTFQGHANVFNVAEAIDFRAGSADVPDWNALLASLDRNRMLVSINHPKVPLGEGCLGCGWAPQPAADLAAIQAVEIVNGQDVESAIAGIPFWHEQLQQGRRLTAIGGSDTHDPISTAALPSSGGIGVPTTVVRARALGIQPILDGIRAGEVFLDTHPLDPPLDTHRPSTNLSTHLDTHHGEYLDTHRPGVQRTTNRLLEFSAVSAGASVRMGGELQLSRGSRAEFHVRVANVKGGRLEIIRDGAPLADIKGARISGDDHRASFTQIGDGGRHWIRVNVRDAEGRLALIGNPIYINWPDAR